MQADPCGRLPANRPLPHPGQEDLSCRATPLTANLGVTDWTVAKHIPETFKDGRAHLLQDGIFPSLEAIAQHAKSDAHKRVVELTPTVCDWMTVDTIVGEV